MVAHCVCVLNSKWELKTFSVQHNKTLKLKKRENELLQQQEKAQKELVDEQIAARQSIPDEKYIKEFAQQYRASISKIEQDTLLMKCNIEKANLPIKEYVHSVKKLKEANNKLFDVATECSAIQAKQAKLNADAKDELQKNIESQMVALGQQELKNDKVKR